MVIQTDQGQNEGGYAVELHVTINGTVFDGRCTIAKPDVRQHFFRLHHPSSSHLLLGYIH
jgi:hypothetical protein